MKKLVFFVILGLFSTLASAQHWHGHGHRHWHPNYGWVIPSIVGGVIVYEVMRNQPPIVVQQPPVVIQQQTQNPPVGYHWQEMIDPGCNCKKIVLVSNQ